MNKATYKKNTIAFLLFFFVFHFFYIPLHVIGCFSAPRTDYSTLKNIIAYRNTFT